MAAAKQIALPVEANLSLSRLRKETASRRSAGRNVISFSGRSESPHPASHAVIVTWTLRIRISQEQRPVRLLLSIGCWYRAFERLLLPESG